MNKNEEKESKRFKGRGKDSKLTKVNKTRGDDKKLPANENGGKPDDSKKFPNFDLLSAEERVVFFKALTEARKNVEKKGVVTRKCFGTIHDEYLKHFDPALEKEKKEESEEEPLSRSGYLSLLDDSFSPHSERSTSCFSAGDPTIEEFANGKFQNHSKEASPCESAETILLDETELANIPNKADIYYIEEVKLNEEKPTKDSRSRNKSQKRRKEQRKQDLDLEASEESSASEFLNHEGEPHQTKTPAYDTLNAEERNMFFKILQEARNNVVQKFPDRKKEILPMHSIVKMYEENQVPKEATELALQEEKEVNLKVNLRLISGDNERLRKQHTEEPRKIEKKKKEEEKDKKEKEKREKKERERRDDIMKEKERVEEMMRRDKEKVEELVKKEKEKERMEEMTKKAVLLGKKEKAEKKEKTERKKEKEDEGEEKKGKNGKKKEKEEEGEEKKGKNGKKKEKEEEGEDKKGKKEKKKEKGEEEEEKTETKGEEEMEKKEKEKKEKMKQTEECQWSEDFPCEKENLHKQESKVLLAKKEYQYDKDHHLEEENLSTELFGKKLNEPVEKADKEKVKKRELASEKPQKDLLEAKASSIMSKEASETLLTDPTLPRTLSLTSRAPSLISRAPSATSRAPLGASEVSLVGSKALSTASNASAMKPNEEAETKSQGASSEEKARKQKLQFVDIKIEEDSEDSFWNAEILEELARRGSSFEAEAGEWWEVEKETSPSDTSKEDCEKAAVEDGKAETKTNKEDKGGTSGGDVERTREEPGKEKGAKEVKDKPETWETWEGKEGGECKEEECAKDKPKVGAEEERGGEKCEKGECSKTQSVVMASASVSEEYNFFNPGPRRESTRTLKSSASVVVSIMEIMSQSKSEASEGEALNLPRREPEKEELMEEMKTVSLPRREPEKEELIEEMKSQRDPREFWGESGPALSSAKVMIVEDNVVERIRKLILYLEEKASKDNRLEKEYVRLLVEYVEYLSKILECLVQKRESREKVLSAYHATDVHLKFKDPKKGGEVRPAPLPTSVSAQNLGRGPVMNFEKQHFKDDTPEREGSKTPLANLESNISFSAEEIRFVPPSSSNKKVVTTKIRLLQDLLKQRAELVDGEAEDFKVVYHPDVEIPPVPKLSAVKLIKDEVEDNTDQELSYRFWKALMTCFTCGRKRDDDCGIFENLGGEAVRVDEPDEKEDAANATINQSTLEVLKASLRKKVIDKYYKR